MSGMLTGDDYFLAIARTVAIGANCTRRQVGALIVFQDRVLATGINGAPNGRPGCLTDGACPRGRHYLVQRVPLLELFSEDVHGQSFCKCGNSWPCHLAVEPGSSYDTELGSCIAVHAEIDAMLQIGYVACRGTTMYVTEKPCLGCARIIEAANIVRVVTFQ